jgi:hypothetical protein
MSNPAGGITSFAAAGGAESDVADALPFALAAMAVFGIVDSAAQAIGKAPPNIVRSLRAPFTWS